MFGGSLGAQRLNEAFGAASWQRRPRRRLAAHPRDGGALDAAPTPACAGYAVRRYVDRMDLAFAARRPRSSRARARPPSARSAPSASRPSTCPYAVGNGEQALNAASAVRAGAAMLIPDAEFTADRVRAEIVPLLADERRRAAMTAAAASVGTRTGTENVVAMIDEALGALSARAAAGQRAGAAPPATPT